MSKRSKRHISGTDGNCGSLRRRGLIKAVMAAAVGLPTIARAEPRTLQFWTTQRGSEQMKVYKDILTRFEKEHADFKVNILAASADAIWEKLTAGFAAGEVPDLISHLPAGPVAQLNAKNLVEPFDDVINDIGKDNFIPSAIDLYYDAARGHYMAATIVNQASNSLWYRKDMLAQAGFEPPTYWDELLKITAATTKSGIFGTCFPVGQTDMGSNMMIAALWQAGGTIVDPDLNVTFNSPQAVAALEFIKEIYRYSPPGSTSYGYDETINSFVTGRVATTPYTGRVLSEVAARNPAIQDKIGVKTYSYKRDGGHQGNRAGFTNLFLPKGGRNNEGAKLLAKWLFRIDNYVAFLHSAPGHNLPVLKSVAGSPQFLNHPLLVKYRGELDILLDNMMSARSELKETPAHKINVGAGEIYSSNLLAQIMQDVIVGGVSPKMAAATGADRIAKIMRG